MADKNKEQPENPETDAAQDEVFAEGAATGEARGDSVAEIEAERDDFREKWLRASADRDNAIRRGRMELDDAQRYRSLELARDILDPLDNLRLAVEAAETTANVGELVEGIHMVLRQFEDVLGRHGAKAIESMGQVFDPNVHTALQQIPSADHEPMTVMQEVQRGYSLHDRLIRPSTVIVASAPPADAPAAEENADA